VVYACASFDIDRLDTVSARQQVPVEPLIASRAIQMGGLSVRYIISTALKCEWVLHSHGYKTSFMSPRSKFRRASVGLPVVTGFAIAHIPPLWGGRTAVAPQREAVRVGDG
jgi:hypothetical protein